ncbi:lipid-binding SYLF domain-containing protein [bacterium]|nr:lipid-binding SYLF domain-containing protein [bacterium]
MKKIKFCLIFIMIFAVTAFSDSNEELAGRIKHAEKTLKYFTDAPDSAIPCQLLHDANAVIFLRQYKLGFVLGAKGGNGIVLAKDRNTGKWSPPAFIATAEGSFGFQIGGKVVDAILLIMNKEGLDLLLKSRFKIGGEISAAAGPVGREAGAKIGVPASGILIYSKAQGLFAGISFEGGVIASDDKSNQKFYNDEDIKIRDILTREKVEMPEVAKPLIKELEEYENKYKETHNNSD